MIYRHPQSRPGTLPPHGSTSVVTVGAGEEEPRGVHGLVEDTLASRHREWVDSLPPLITPEGQELLKEDILPHSHRHTYAQRHADAGSLSVC
ncbi:hypothetical protein GCM10009548_92780 [Streptomyces malaysiensis subsp. malaysiensis]